MVESKAYFVRRLTIKHHGKFHSNGILLRNSYCSGRNLYYPGHPSGRGPWARNPRGRPGLLAALDEHGEKFRMSNNFNR